VIVSSDQENAAYPSGLCRACSYYFFYAGAKYPDAKVLKMAITAASDTNQTTPIPPCGSCRQSIAEYEIKQEMPMKSFYGRNRFGLQIRLLKNLLPFMFDKKILLKFQKLAIIF
jgi:cytidine deaminase